MIRPIRQSPPLPYPPPVGGRVGWGVGPSLVLLGALALSLSGCQSMGAAFSNTVSGTIDMVTGGGDTTEPPKPLESIEAEIEIETIWDEDAGAGDGGQWLSLGVAGEGDRLYVADHEGRVTAFNLQNGDEIWQVDTGLALSAGPALGMGKVLLGTIEAQVVALDQDSGERLWTGQVSSEVLAPPRAGRKEVAVHTVDGAVFALDIDSGERLWSTDQQVSPLSLRGLGAPEILEDKVLVGFANGRMAMMRLSDGKVVWEKQVAVPSGMSELERVVDIDATPVIRDGMVYVTAYHGGVIAATLLDGEVIWRNEEIIASASPAITWRYVFVTDTDSDVWGLDETTGRTYWKQAALHHRRLTAPVPYGEWLAVGDYKGYVHFLAQEDGRQVGRERVFRSPIRTPPVVIGDVLIVYSSGGDVAVLKVEH